MHNDILYKPLTIYIWWCLYLELVYINVVKMGLGIDPVGPIGPANLGWKYTKAIVIKSQRSSGVKHVKSTSPNYEDLWF